MKIDVRSSTIKILLLGETFFIYLYINFVLKVIFYPIDNWYF